MSAQEQQRWNQTSHAISKMRREGVSLSQASREFKLDPRRVVRLAGPALRKRKSGRYVATPTDRRLRVVTIVDEKGPLNVATRDSREAQVLSDWWRAVGEYLRTGNEDVLRNLRRKTVVDASGKRIRLLLDPDMVRILDEAGLLNPESIYAHIA